MSRLKSTWLSFAALAAFTAAALHDARTGMAQEADKMQRTVTVSASGKVTADPDVARISTGVVSEGDTAKDAITRNNGVMGKLVEGLRGAGISPKDIQTTSFSVEPRYTQHKDGRPATISGYRVLNQVRLTVRDVRRLGEILDQAIALGANRIDQISFDLADPELLLDQARQQAMQNARRRGELYAQAAGAQLGPVLRIFEGGGDFSPVAATARAGFRATSVPIEAGTRNLEVEVNVVYALR